MFYYMLALIIISFNIFKVDYDLEDFSKLYPIIGEWSMPFKEGQLTEKWDKKYDKMLFGETLYSVNDKVISKESIKLALTNGRIYYTPLVYGQNNDEPVPFVLIESEENRFVFENKEHDFPQKIIYELKSKDVLNATVEGETEKGFKKIVYKFKRNSDKD